MKIRAIMSPPPEPVGPDTPVTEIAERLLEARCNSLPILDTQNGVVGMISTGDLTHRLADEHVPERESWWRESLYRSPLRRGSDHPDRSEGRTAAAVMSRRVISVGPDDDTSVAARMLLEHRIHAVPVLEDDRLIGMVSRFDMIRCLVEHPDCCNPMRQ